VGEAGQAPPASQYPHLSDKTPFSIQDIKWHRYLLRKHLDSADRQ
jgi:hypothetical protein